MGVVLASLKQLWMISCSNDITEGKPLQLVSMATIAGCLEAVPLAELSMMLVLDEVGRLDLYSGLLKVGGKGEWSRQTCGALQMKSLDFQSVPVSLDAVPAGVAHPVGDSFSVSFSSGVSCRCALPYPATPHPISRHLPW